MEPVLILIIGAVLASGTSTAAFTETAVIPSELTKSASYRSGAFTFSATLSSLNPSLALSIKRSVSLPTTISCSGVGWQAAAPNATAMQSRIAIYLFIIVSSVAPC